MRSSHDRRAAASRNWIGATILIGLALLTLLLVMSPDVGGKKPKKKKNQKDIALVGTGDWAIGFKDDFEGRSELGDGYIHKVVNQPGFTVNNGVLTARQMKPR